MTEREAAFLDWNPRDLDGLAGLRPEDPGYESFRRDSVCAGSPNIVVRPHEEAEVVEVVRFAAKKGIPITVAAGLTGMAGGAVTDEGILLSTAGLPRSWEILEQGPSRATIRASAGWVLGELQHELARAGWFYPPDPTSRNEALLGGTIATNATGEDTLLYGPTRQWIRGLRVVTATGEVMEFHREQPPPPEVKGTAGYYLDGEPVDWFIGSEGTLGIILSATLEVVPMPAMVYSGLAFFPSLATALDFVVAAREGEEVTPRALELMDGESLRLASDNHEGICIPTHAQAAVVFRQEGPTESTLEAWISLLRRSLGQQGEWVDAALVFESDRDRERLRSFRHRVPMALHEKIEIHRDQGGAKVGTDWWVPYPRLSRMLDRWLPRIEAKNLDAVVFGHVGNGHPHVNMLTRNERETREALELVRGMCRDAVALEGGVAGEHGLGKLKRDLLPIQFPGGYRAMRDIKKHWDPGWILGRGNLFLPEESS